MKGLQKLLDFFYFGFCTLTIIASDGNYYFFAILRECANKKAGLAKVVAGATIPLFTRQHP